MTKLALIIKDKHLRVKDLIRELDLAQGTVYNAIKRGYFLKMEENIRFARLVGISIIDFFNDDLIRRSDFFKENEEYIKKLERGSTETNYFESKNEN